MRFAIIALCISCFPAFGQEAITLQECLDKAMAFSPRLAKETSLLQSAQIERSFHSWSLLPNLAASTGFNTSFGRRLDPFTNTFATTNVNSQLIGLNSSITLFNGFSYYYKRGVLNGQIRESELSLAKKQNDLKIEVIEAYVTLCKLTAQINLARVRIEKYAGIQEIQRLLIEGGKINAVDTLKSYNSMLNEKTLLSNLSNEVKLKTMDLNFLVGLPLLSSHAFVLTSVSEIVEKPKLSEVFGIEALEVEQQMLADQIEFDRAGILPNLSLNGLIGTGFSTNNKDYAVPGTPTKRYGDQINQNLYEGIGVYLSIPIFNRGNWLKSKQLYQVRQTEMENSRQLSVLALEKQRLTNDQNRLRSKAKQEEIAQMAFNLQKIYETTVLLYEDGRTTYTELETTFLEWQTRLIELESVKLDYEVLKLYE